MSVLDLASEFVHFDALSYAWGDIDSHVCMRIDGREDFGISVELDRVLRHLRTKEKDLVLWAYSICINQADARERRQQVSIMGEIYAKADAEYI
jgi:hypothetical protein